MNILWKKIEKSKLNNKAKTYLFLFFNSVMCGVLGLLVWLVVSRFALNTIDWAICFAGYPALFIGLFGGFFFLFRKN